MAKKFWEIYIDHFTNIFTGGNLANREKLSQTSVKTMFSRVLTQSHIKKVILIRGIEDVDLDVNLPEEISKKLRAEIQNYKVNMVFSMVNVPTDLQLSDKFRRQMKDANTAYEREKQFLDSLSDTDKRLGFKQRIAGRMIRTDSAKVKELENWKRSYDYVAEVINNNGSMTLSFVAVELSATKGHIVDRAVNIVSKYLDSKNIRNIELRGNMFYHMSNFSPISYYSGTVGKKYKQCYFSDENVATFIPNSTIGVIDEGDGILLGVEPSNGIPRTVNFTESGAGQNALICARTGHGKTYMAFTAAFSMLIQGHHISALDIKGNEWTALTKYFPSIIVDIGGNNPRFVNVLRLDDIYVTPQTCRSFYASAVSGIKTLVSILCGLNPISDSQKISKYDAIINEAVTKLYNNKKVFSDIPSSFINSKNIKYSDLIPFIRGLGDSSSYTEEQHEYIQDILICCENFFRAEGEYTGLFDNEVTIGEVINTPLVIYSMNKNEEKNMDKIDNIRAFMIQFLDKKKKAMRKRQNLFSFTFFEELQRSNEFLTLLNFIVGNVTGGRSNNDCVFLLCNSLAMFDAENNIAMRPILSNITTYIFGALDNTDIETVERRFQCKPIIPYLREIADKPSENRNVFALYADTGKHILSSKIRAEVPEEMEEDFATRTVMKKSKSRLTV